MKNAVCTFVFLGLAGFLFAESETCQGSNSVTEHTFTITLAVPLGANVSDTVISADFTPDLSSLPDVTIQGETVGIGESWLGDSFGENCYEIFYSSATDMSFTIDYRDGSGNSANLPEGGSVEFLIAVPAANPPIAGYEITTSWVDAYVSAVGVSNCTTNTAPTIGTMTWQCTDTHRVVTVRAPVSDADGDSFDADSFNWSASDGISLASATEGYDDPDGTITFECTNAVNTDPVRVTCTVDDGNGGTSEETYVDVTPNNRPGITNPAGMPTETEYQVAFSADVADEDLTDGDDETNLSYLWDFGYDVEEAAQTSVEAAPDWTFPDDAAAGTEYEVTLTVTDSCGVSTTTESFTVIPNTAPSGTPSSTPGVHGIHINGAYYDTVPFKIVFEPTIDDENPNGVTDIQWTVTAPDEFDTDDYGFSVDGDDVLTLQCDSPGEYSISYTMKDEFETAGTSETATVYAMPWEDVAFPHAFGLPRDPAKAPTIDGILSGPDTGADDYGESGWTGSYRIPFADGTDPHLTVDLIRDGESCYVGIAMDFDATLSEADTVYLGFGPQLHGNSDTRVVPTHGFVGLISYKPATGELDVYTTDADGGWINEPLADEIGIQPAKLDGENRWTIEFRVPMSASAPVDWLRIAGQGVFFFDIIRHEMYPSGVVRFAWPPGRDRAEGSPDYDNPAFNPAFWGIAHFSDTGTQNGVSIAGRSAVGVTEDPGNLDAPLGSRFSYNPGLPDDQQPVNHIVARVTNGAYRMELNGDEAVQVPVEAPGIRVRFSLANWGIPALNPVNWTEIPGVNPTAFETIAAGTMTGDGLEPTVTEYQLDWQLSSAVFDQYQNDDDDGINERHQCMLVEIETQDEVDTVPVVHRSVYRNMDFVEQDRFYLAPATVSGVGYGNPPRRDNHYEVVLRLFTREWSVDPEAESIQKILASAATSGASKDSVPVDSGESIPYLAETARYIAAAEDTLYFIEYIVKAYLKTGRYATVGGEEVEIMRPIGSYGYVARHEGQTEEWEVEIRGAEQIGEKSYLLRVPADGEAVIEDFIDALGPKRSTLTLAAGAVIPDDRFSSRGDATGAVSVGVDFQILSNHGSAGLVVGYAPYPRDANSAGTFYTQLLTRGVANPGSRLEGFVDLTVGGYWTDSRAPEWGAGLGLGLRCFRANRFGWHASVEYHLTENDGWIQLMAGSALRFRIR